MDALLLMLFFSMWKDFFSSWHKSLSMNQFITNEVKILKIKKLILKITVLEVSAFPVLLFFTLVCSGTPCVCFLSYFVVFYLKVSLCLVSLSVSIRPL